MKKRLDKKSVQPSKQKPQRYAQVVVGRSNIVGKQLANLLVRREYNATVTICHTGTKDLAPQKATASAVMSILQLSKNALFYAGSRRRWSNDNCNAFTECCRSG